MKNLFKNIFYLINIIILSHVSFAKEKIMNPGETHGQLIVITQKDLFEKSAKYNSLSPLSIPVFLELPLDLSVVAGVITLQEQNLLSHVQIKSKPRKSPNLDISSLEGGLLNPLFNNFKDGDWVHLVLTTDGQVIIEASTKEAAIQFYEKKKLPPVTLVGDYSVKEIYHTEDLTWKDFDKVGSKAANYGELAKVLNTDEKTHVKLGLAIPFYYYKSFIDSNPAIANAINRLLKDPLVKKVERSEYRDKKLSDIRKLIEADSSVINQDDLELILNSLNDFKNDKDVPRKMKLRSSTNSEDLPNFNGAGLYISKSYDPTKKKVELSLDEKKAELTKTLKSVWASIWNLRAFDERTLFSIPHDQVLMGLQVNPSFGSEKADGVIVTKNVSGTNPDKTGIYIETQRGDEFSVANPTPGLKSEKILVEIDRLDPLNQDKYHVIILQKSNVGDDEKTILPNENPNNVLFENEIKTIAHLSLKAEKHFKEIFGPDQDDFALDLEFKVDISKKGVRQVYFKQARPYIQ